MSDYITIRVMRGRSRIALGDQHETIEFVRCWMIYRGDERQHSLFLGKRENGEICGVKGSQVLCRSDILPAQKIAANLVTIADHLARERARERRGTARRVGAHS